jgi:hypothetical protein
MHLYYQIGIFYINITVFVCFELHEQFFSSLAAVTIAGDRVANLDLCFNSTYDFQQ